MDSGKVTFCETVQDGYTKAVQKDPFDDGNAKYLVWLISRASASDTGPTFKYITLV